MKRSQRLAPVLQMTERSKQQAERQLGQLQQHLLEEKNKLAQLEAYRDEYQQNIFNVGAGGTQIENLRRMQAFLERLSQAIEQQSQQIALVEQRVVEATKVWQGAYAKHQAMDSLIQRSQQEEQRAEDKQQQKAIDELSQQRFSRR